MHRVPLITLRRQIVLGWLAVGSAVALWLPLRVDDPRYGWSLAWWLLGAPLLMLGVTVWRGGIGGPGPALRGDFALSGSRALGRASTRRGGHKMARRRFPVEAHKRGRAAVHGRAMQ